MNNEFGNLVRSLREERGKSRGQVARDTGFTELYISRIELGYRVPMKITTLVRLASSLNTSVDALIEVVVKTRIARLHKRGIDMKGIL